MTLALVRPIPAVAWELRAAWATGRRVALSLERADVGRLEGHISKIAATDAHVTVNGRMVPLDRFLAVHLPSRLGDSTVQEGERWRGRARKPISGPGQDELPLTE